MSSCRNIFHVDGNIVEVGFDRLQRIQCGQHAPPGPVHNATSSSVPAPAVGEATESSATIKESSTKTVRLLLPNASETVHTNQDVCGPLQVKSMSGAKYLLNFYRRLH